MPPLTRINRSSLPDHASINSGKERNLRVCPVGAVSNTTTSQVGFSMCFSSSSNANASSRPGRIISAVLTSDFMSSNSCFAFESSIMPKPPMPPNPPFPPLMLFMASPTFGSRLESLASGSISKPNRPGTPSTGVGTEPRVASRESEVEWAGSLETNNTRSPLSASQTAVAEEVVVFPTPPFPPNNSNRDIARRGGWGV